MAVFTWKESYSVHVDRLDAQHQKLFETINGLAEAMRAGKGDEVIRDVVGKLAVYTRTHFLQEETLMQQTGYPGLAAHKQQHSKLMADVETYKRDLEEGRRTNSIALLSFLQNWLVEHIQKSDKAYSLHLNTHGVH